MFNPNFETKYNNNLKAIKPLGLRIQKHIQDSNIDLNIISEFNIPDIPIWEIPKPTVNLDLSKLKKSETNPLEFNQKFAELKCAFNSFEETYTDGSKDNNKVASAAVHQNNIFSSRLPNNSSIFTAEAKALQLAMNFVNCSKNKKHIIFSDSLSCLQAIKNKKVDHPYIYHILKEYTILKQKGYVIIFCWVPNVEGEK